MTGPPQRPGSHCRGTGVSKQFPTDHKARVHAVTEVSLHIDHGETLAVVGESGWGNPPWQTSSFVSTTSTRAGSFSRESTSLA
ncbi:MAG: hypothetical protein Ct9H300mP12_15850 [Acidimicrobiales bacterium]|nr:MAG: hypothetical protein Ct9H300mP12_15850 [Acidimicrobiales bacterium]